MQLRVTTIVATIVVLLFVQLATGEAEQNSETDTESSQPPPASEPTIKLVHKLNPGEREYLSPNLIGVQNIAMTFLPLTLNFINIIDAYREIVNGVRYEIFVNAVDTKDNDADIICRLVILEKPWLRTDWGDKVRELQHSNCTSDADNLTDPAAQSNAINDKYARSTIFNGGNRNELTDNEMTKLEAQILGSDNKQRYNDASAAVTTSPTTTTTTTTTSPIIEETTTEANFEADAVAQTVATLAAAISDAAAIPQEDVAIETTTQIPELNDDAKNWLDDIFSVGAIHFENTRKNQNVDSQLGESDGESNYVQPTVFAEQQQEQQFSSQQQQEQQQQQQEEYAAQEQQVHARAKRDANTLVGGPSKLDNKEAEKRLGESLAKLAEGDGPSYKISKIHSASKQIVSGTVTKIDADLENGDGAIKRCLISIWSQPWLPNGNEVKVSCGGDKTVKTRYSRAVEYAEKKTHKKRNHHNLDKTEHLFNKFQIKFNRQYHNTMERQMRLRIFQQNLKTIEELNRNEMGSAKYGITEFADMTSSEYKQRTGLWQRDTSKVSFNTPAVIPEVELPKEFDWREKGAISSVKNQGNCGSCWAFSVTGNIEGLHAVKTGKLEEYSEQELLDCDTIDSACNGGLPDNAYKALEKIGGLELESEYPYEGRKKQCHFDKTLSHVKVQGAVDLPKNETAIAQWLITNGPISIGINANAMQFYRGGVSHPWRPLCAHSNLDHGVLIVGYGVSDYPMFKKTLPYWIIKNSWGPKWGEQGYYRVYRGDNTCGVSEMATSAVLAN